MCVCVYISIYMCASTAWKGLKQIKTKLTALERTIIFCTESCGTATSQTAVIMNSRSAWIARSRTTTSHSTTFSKQAHCQCTINFSLLEGSTNDHNKKTWQSPPSLTHHVMCTYIVPLHQSQNQASHRWHSSWRDNLENL